MATFTIKLAAVLLALAMQSVSAEEDCGVPGDIEHGVVNTSRGTGYLDVVTYSCDPGFTLTGDSARVCERDGTWGCDAPTCDPVDCGNPSSLENGMVDVADGTTFRRVIAYECDVGYNLNGVSERVCQRDGTWGCEEPTCIAAYRCPYGLIRNDFNIAPVHEIPGHPSFCGDGQYNKVSGLSDYVVLWLHTDAVGNNQFGGLRITATYAPVPTASVAMDTGAALNHCRWHQNGHTIAVGDDMGHIYTYGIAESFANPKSDEWSRFVHTLQELRQHAAEREEDTNLAGMGSPLR